MINERQKPAVHKRNLPENDLARAFELRREMPLAQQSFCAFLAEGDLVAIRTSQAGAN